MALLKGSRYETTTPFQPDGSGRVGFRGLRPRALGNAEPALEHVIVQGDRLDALGQHYYSRTDDWYRIAEVNTDYLFPEDILHETPAEKAGEPAAVGDGKSTERLGATILIPRREERT
jgi:hypothetical protein